MRLAVAQLRRLSGRKIRYHTAVTLIDGPQGRSESILVDTVVGYRTLDDTTIARYLSRERPYDCAGSARIEGLGIAPGVIKITCKVLAGSAAEFRAGPDTERKCAGSDRAGRLHLGDEPQAHDWRRCVKDGVRVPLDR